VLQVANKRTGADADRFDYLKRDSMMCGVAVPLDAKRLMLFSRLSPDRSQVRSCPGWRGVAVVLCRDVAVDNVGGAHRECPVVACCLCREVLCAVCCVLCLAPTPVPPQIVFKQTEYHNLAVGLFQSRAEMHRRVYTHQ
jgi:HD superfamily phosphohydrolase